MTLAFGGTLIGVCLDYPIHRVAHHVLGSAVGREAAVRGAIRAGALTTAIGFAGLAAADVPGVREIGIFAASGVLGALVTTQYLLPELLPSMPRPTTLPARVAAGLARILAAMGRRRAALWAILGITLFVIFAGFFRLDIDDDVYALNFQPAADWVEEDLRVRDRVSRVDTGRFVVALGDGDEMALRRNDAVFARLEAARDEGVIEGFRSLHPFLFSADLQRRNLAALRAVPERAARMRAALEAQGFRAEAFPPLAELSDIQAVEPLDFEDLAASPLATLAAPHRLEFDDQVAFLSLLRGVEDPVALEASLAGLPGVHFVDQRALLQRAYRETRTRATQLAGLGLVAVLALLVAHYRSLRRGVVALLPALLAAGASVAVLSLFAVPLNLMHLLALLLVLSIGVDYAVFLLASPGDADARAASAFSLLVACASTLLAFGLLAFSSFPALRPLGVTTGLGVSLSLLLAPIVVLLSETRRAQ